MVFLFLQRLNFLGFRRFLIHDNLFMKFYIHVHDFYGIIFAVSGF